MENSQYNIDLSEREFGSLTAKTRILAVNKKYYDKWRCRCSCGNNVNVSAYNLIRGKSTSCGPNHKDITGEKFGKLTVIKRLKNSRNNQSRRWLCICNCGENRVVDTNKLLNGTISCCKNHRGYKDRKTPALNSLFYNYKYGAKKRDLIFNLSKNDFIQLINQNCCYCGTPPRNIIKKYKASIIQYNGIDRLDNKKGYIIDNCVSCCKICNRAKLKRTLQEFIEWGMRLGKEMRNNYREIVDN